MLKSLFQAVRFCFQGADRLDSGRDMPRSPAQDSANSPLVNGIQATPVSDWKIVYESVAGTSHFKSGVPCQDNGLAVTIKAGKEIVFVAACSDGASTAQFSEFGSALAASTMIDLIQGALEADLPVGKIDQERMRDWFKAVRSRLEEEAVSRTTESRELACTLLAAVVGSTGAVFAQLGDGAIVIRGKTDYEPIFWPQSGEYANTTNFLTDQTSLDRIAFESREGRVDEVALFTDGIQMLALSYAERKAHAPFFLPMFESLAKNPDPVALIEPLRQFLSSDKVNERTDDDKTLILATRTVRHDIEHPV